MLEAFLWYAQHGIDEKDSEGKWAFDMNHAMETHLSNHWRPATDREIEIMKKLFSRTERHRGRLPDEVFVVKRHKSKGPIQQVAMKYNGVDGKLDRWGILLSPACDICTTWSKMKDVMNPLVGDQHFIEVYPNDENVLNAAPIRWFWVLRDSELPSEFDLR
jgi:hypothetical protein